MSTDKGTNGTEVLVNNNGNANPEHADSPPPKPAFGQRYVFLLLAFLGLAVAYILRVVLFVSIVTMVKPTKKGYKGYSQGVNGSTNSSLFSFTTTVSTLAPTSPIDTSAYECVVNQSDYYASNKTYDFEWSETGKGLALGSFFWGYLVTQIPGGVFAERYGAKWFFGIGVGGTALFTLITPPATRWLGLTGMIICRAIEGFMEGVTLPAMHTLLHSWAPEEDRSWMTSVTFSGMLFGTMITYPLGALLSEKISWDAAFYIFGALGIIWTIAWCLLVYESPLTHPFIHADEKRYLEHACHLNAHKGKKPPFPIKGVLTSLPFMATTVAHFVFNWGYYSMLTLLPQFMSSVLKFEIKQNGMILMLPYLAHLAVLYTSSPLADKLRAKGILTKTTIRKIWASLGFILPAIPMCLLYFAACSRIGVVVLLVFAVACQAFAISGFYVNHLDLAPQFAGTLMGITNMMGTIPGIISPIIAGLITDSNPSNRILWMIFFWITAGIYAAGTTFFIIFASGDLQPWSGESPTHAPTEVPKQGDHPLLKSDPEKGASGIGTNQLDQVRYGKNGAHPDAAADADSENAVLTVSPRV